MAVNNSDGVDYGFIDPHALRDAASQHGRYPETQLRLESDHIIVPMSMIVSAQGLESWEGRGAGNLKDKRPSKEVIQDYASRSSEIPGVNEGIDLYLGPGSEVFVVSHNAHRVAAAKLKGQESIEACGPVDVYFLEKIPPTLTAQD